MREAPVLVVGAGLAGLSAATELARAGLQVWVIDHAPRPGGAVHRQPLPDVKVPSKPRWAALMREVAAQGERIRISCGTGFAGVDRAGNVLLTGAMNRLFRPKALVLAVGGVERVQPRLGWTLPGVQTAGSIQAQMKTTGEAPQGRVLLAGSGPLLLAVGAELCRLGRPPVALIEAAHPIQPLQAVRLPMGYKIEAARYLTRLVAAGVPMFWGSDLGRIERTAGGLQARLATRHGLRVFSADTIGLHDGIRPNDIGLTAVAGLPVRRLGDCRETLGARAALADGRAGGAALAAELLGLPAPPERPEVARERRAQVILARIYQHDFAARLRALPKETVICRCENRTLADLDALGAVPTARQLRLDGRFSMGDCQGRFCAEWVRKIGGLATEEPQIGAVRWPIKPLSVADLLASADGWGDDADGQRNGVNRTP